MLKITSRGVLLAAFLVISSAAHALAVNQLFVFGDSLSDSGNAAALTQVAPGVSFFPPSQPNQITSTPTGIPYDYHFSNGSTALEQLAGLLGTAPSLPAWPTSPDNSNSNFAVGGAMTGPQPNPTGGPPSLLCCNYNFLADSPAGVQNFAALQNTGINDQIALFGSRRLNGTIPAFDPAHTLFSVWGGPNDIFLALALGVNAGLPAAQLDALLKAYASNAANNLKLDIGSLAGLGAQNFLVPNMPDLGETPFGLSSGLSGELTIISKLFNTDLDAALEDLRQSQGLDIIEFDTFDALSELIDSGMFANTTQPCLDTTNAGTVQATLPNVLGGCQGYLFFDSVHPTLATAAILAAEMQIAVPEPNVLALLTVALLALGWFGPARQRK
jgi:phospholipase/lecithinase/hemolysin